MIAGFHEGRRAAFPGGSVVLSYATNQCTCGSRPIPYAIRQSARARQVSLTMHPSLGLLGTLPNRRAPEELHQFIHRHERWVRRQLDRWTRRTEGLPRPWPYGHTLLYRGEAHRVIIIAAKRSGIERTADRSLIVRAHRPTRLGITRILKRWYVAEASRWIAETVEIIGRQLGVTWGRVGVRDQRTRWGSCSAQGHLNFNYRLMMAPPPVAEYVVLHELAHRRELNHSKRFWELVAAHCPTYQASIRWLRTYGPMLL